MRDLRTRETPRIVCATCARTVTPYTVDLTASVWETNSRSERRDPSWRLSAPREIAYVEVRLVGVFTFFEIRSSFTPHLDLRGPADAAEARVTPLPFSFRQPTPTATPRTRRLLLVQREGGLARDWSRLLENAGIAVDRAGSGIEALAALERFEPDVALLDVMLPDGDGVELVQEVARRKPLLPIVVASSESAEQRVLGALRAGASGYVFSDDMEQRVVAVVEEAMRGGSPMSRPVARLLLEACRGHVEIGESATRLTRRERGVLSMLAEGHSYSEVGASLGVSENTVRSHVRSIYEKLGVSSKTEAVMAALRLGLVRVR
jgi:DNA-binding NarL/FixJ family response regulator